MRKLVDVPNTDTPTTDYPKGRIRNKNISNVPPIVGTPIIEELYGDIVQFFQRLLVLSGITENQLPDNVTNGYQTVEALLKTTELGLFKSWLPLENVQGWGYVTDGSFSAETIEIRYQKIGKTVNICFNIILTTAAPGTYARWSKVGTTPEEQYVDLIPVNIQRSLVFITTNKIAQFYIDVSQGVFSFGFDMVNSGDTFSGGFSLVTNFSYEIL